jgi:ribokinase
MKVLNFGSLNIDKVYTVPHFVRPGETLSSINLDYFPGGKGLNQSIALAKAGVPVYHAGKIGQDGALLLRELEKAGVNTGYILTDPRVDSGHAIIQVDASGQNNILLFGGANQTISPEDVDRVLASFDPGDFLLLQNEISSLDYLIDRAAQKGMTLVLNPAPMDDKLKAMDFTRINWLILNEIEGLEMTGKDNPQDICEQLLNRSARIKIVLTLGRGGAIYADAHTRLFQDIFDKPVVDTTAAGDTFTGYFICSIIEGKGPMEALKLASMASALEVGRKGASTAIPLRAEVEEALSC